MFTWFMFELLLFVGMWTSWSDHLERVKSGFLNHKHPSWPSVSFTKFIVLWREVFRRLRCIERKKAMFAHRRFRSMWLDVERPSPRSGYASFGVGSRRAGKDLLTSMPIPCSPYPCIRNSHNHNTSNLVNDTLGWIQEYQFFVRFGHNKVEGSGLQNLKRYVTIGLIRFRLNIDAHSSRFLIEK